MSIKKILYAALVVVLFFAAIYLLLITFFSANELLDFPVFYGSGWNAIHGLTIYTYYGYYHLPFWYFPWTSWIFIPLAVFSKQVAWTLFFMLGVVVAFLSIILLTSQYGKFSWLDRLFMFSLMVWISWLAFRVGQISFLILAAVVLLIFFIQKERSFLAGLLIPILLIKPHLFIIFIPVLLWLGGKKTLVAGTMITLVLLGIGFLVTPNWPSQMLNLLLAGTHRVESDPFWNFSTLPTMLGLSQNYTGTANLPIIVIQVLIASLAVIRFHHLPKAALLALALAASLFCAPRSYAYDLALLIPAMVWLSEKWSFKTAMVWITCAIIVVVSHYSTYSYLVTLLVFLLGIYHAFQVERQNGSHRSFWGKQLKTFSR